MERSLVIAGIALIGACVGPGKIAGDGSSETDGTSDTGIMPLETSTSTDPDEGPQVPDFDTGGWDDPPEPWGPVEIDVLIVVDNSASMAEEQQKLAAAAPQLFEHLLQLGNDDGPYDPDINVMVTSTDMGHPLCTPFQPDGYQPKQGAPQEIACIDRLTDFTSVGVDPIELPQACESVCPVAVEPVDPFVHVEDPQGATTNVPGNQVGQALACLIPQGINGCGYEAPLESMLQALDPAAPWNQGNKPFLREDAALAIVIVSDEADCSVRAPEGYAYFTDPNLDTYWEINPDTGTKTDATSAVCWNAGVDCGMPDMDGVYADCTAVDNEVLHPTQRYVDFLVDTLGGGLGKEVVMVAISGVPRVTIHNHEPPYEPIAGGVLDLVYRDWIEGAWPSGDALPGEDAATNQYLFGIGPGCTAEDGMGGFHGQAIPPVRIKEVCQALDGDEGPRCCIESVCDGDYDSAIQCMTGLLQTVIEAG